MSLFWVFHGIRWGNPIAEMLEKRFHEGFEDVELFNFGVVSSNSGMELASVVHEILNAGPITSFSITSGRSLLSLAGPTSGYPFISWPMRRIRHGDRRRYSLDKSIDLGSNLFRDSAARYPSQRMAPGQEQLRGKPIRDTPWKGEDRRRLPGNAMKAQTALRLLTRALRVLPALIYTRITWSEGKTLCAEQGRAYYEEMREKVRSMRQERFSHLNLLTSATFMIQSGATFLLTLFTQPRRGERPWRSRSATGSRPTLSGT